MGELRSLVAFSCLSFLGCEMGMMLKSHLLGMVAMGIKSTSERALYSEDRRYHIDVSLNTHDSYLFKAMHQTVFLSEKEQTSKGNICIKALAWSKIHRELRCQKSRSCLIQKVSNGGGMPCQDS